MAQLKEKITSIIDGGIDSSELSQIEELKQEFSCLSPEARKEVEDILDAALKSASEETKQAIHELKNSICEEGKTPEYSFEKLSQRSELTHIKNSFFAYFEQETKEKLSALSPGEQESLKILLWSDFLALFSDTSTLGIFMNSIENKTGGALKGLLEIEQSDTKDLNELLTQAEKVFSEFTQTPELQEGFETVMEEKFGVRIEAVHDYKIQNPGRDISDLHALNEILQGKNDQNMSSEELYKSIEKQSEELANSLGRKQKMGKELAHTIENLPFDMGKNVKEWIQGLVEKWPFLGILVGLIMGPDYLGEFLSEEETKRRKSLQNLFTLSQDNTSPLSGVFSESFGTEFDTKKVEGFFKYLESEKIDYSGDDFWTELISGESKNTHIQKISKLLTSEYGEKIFEKKDEENKGEGFAKKLNSLEELANREEVEARDKELETVAAALPALSTIVSESTAPETAKDTGEPNNTQEVPEIEESDAEGVNPVINTKEKTPESPPLEISVSVRQEYKDFRDTVIKTALMNAYRFPISISYAGKEQELKTLGIKTPKSIDFKNGVLNIDGKVFSPKFESFTVTKFGQTFTVNNLQVIGNPILTKTTMVLECQTENLGFLAGVQKAPVSLEKTKILEIVQSLIQTGKYNGKIPAQSDTPEISYEIS